jgi:hypothetical protein
MAVVAAVFINLTLQPLGGVAVDQLFRIHQPEPMQAKPEIHRQRHRRRGTQVDLEPTAAVKIFLWVAAVAAVARVLMDLVKHQAQVAQVV